MEKRCLAVSVQVHASSSINRDTVMSRFATRLCQIAAISGSRITRRTQSHADERFLRGALALLSASRPI